MTFKPKSRQVQGSYYYLFEDQFQADVFYVAFSVFSSLFLPSPFVSLQFMDLRTRYTALVTLMTQYIKFAGDSLKRLEEEEVSHPLKANQAKRTARQMKSNTSAEIIHNVSSRYRLLELLKYSALYRNVCVLNGNIPIQISKTTLSICFTCYSS